MKARGRTDNARFREPEVKELYVDKDVVLLVSACTGDDSLTKAQRSDRKTALVAMLLNRALGRRDNLDARNRSTVGHVELSEGFLGKPELFVDGQRGPSASFSYAIGSTWAAVCPSGASIGIDVSDPEEFAGNYPFRRVFHAGEFRLASVAAGTNRLAAAALLWSAKEAVVKALGCGFHLVAPLDVRVSSISSSPGITRACVDFSETTKIRFHALHHATVRVASFRESKGWVSTALSSWTITCEATQP
jgi:phosphopantetheinyl transferase